MAKFQKCRPLPSAYYIRFGSYFTHESCGSVDMIENYMDYTYDACMNIFTNDQTLRMRTVLTKSPRRRELLSSTVHLEPVALDAAIIDIVSPKGQRCNGNALPEVLLRNGGQSQLSSVTIHYQVDAGEVKTYAWSGALKSGDIELVTLPAISAPDGNHTLTVYTSTPNGGADARPANDQWRDDFIISSVGEKLDFLEAFEGGLYPPSNKWQIENADRCESWSPYSNITGADGQLSTTVFLNYYDYDAKGSSDGLVLPLLNLDTPEDSNLEFDVAYADAGDAQDKLEVFVSVDCGLTYKSIYSKAGAALATAPQQDGAFYPTADQWRREVLNLNNYRSKQVLVKFVGTNGYGNNFFLDNIYVSGASAEAEPIALKKFTASSVSAGVELQWLTSSEENYLHFVVERSADGSNFEQVLSVEAKKGNGSGAAYKVLDRDPFAGTTYYRLKIERSSGLNALYSQTISTKTKGTKTTARTAQTQSPSALKGLYPNPSRGSFELAFEAQQAGAIRLELVNSMGQLLHSQEGRCQAGVNQASVRASALPKGIYFVLLHTPDGTIKDKVIIQ